MLAHVGRSGCQGPKITTCRFSLECQKKKKQKPSCHHLREGVVVTEALATYCHGVFSLLSIIFVDHRRNLVWLEIFGL